LRAHENSEQYVAALALMQAMLSATTKLGIQGIFRRLVASELPDNLWQPDIELNEGAGHVSVRARHLCPPSCPLTIQHCFTALKIENIVSKRKSQPYAVSSVRSAGDDIEVSLQLFL
jgi:hypothetical protein